jgi:hypothetical protein
VCRIKRHFRGVPKTPATVQSDEESSSNDSSTVMCVFFNYMV